MSNRSAVLKARRHVANTKAEWLAGFATYADCVTAAEQYIATVKAACLANSYRAPRISVASVLRHGG